MKNICLLSLNELNFEYISRYIENGVNLPNFERMLDTGIVTSSSEDVYEYLEPWIQWPSVYTGKTYDEHKIFRLGDVVNFKGIQLFEEIENRGYSVGSLSAMNAKNNLLNPAFFIPDPWTDTEHDGGMISMFLTQALRQTVNDNTGGKITSKSAAQIIATAAALIPFKRYPYLVRKLRWALKKSWRKAMFLDVLIVELFHSLVLHNKPNFCTVFMNAAAHTQHHYLLSSPVVEKPNFKNPSWYIEPQDDPLLEVYILYDELIGRLMGVSNYNFVIATGLSQIAQHEPIFYYRLKNHSEFLKLLNIQFRSVEPRMTRDFLVKFDNQDQLEQGFEVLSQLTIDSIHLFGAIERRDKELFITMDYPKEINRKTKLDQLDPSNDEILMEEHVNFVAIKNGKHCPTGYIWIDPTFEGNMFRDGAHVSNLHKIILDCFQDKSLI